jgi:LysR family transcriptional regulator (chromosome initiation inhibitor)
VPLEKVMKTQLDYKLLQALATVIKHQSFERAANSLFITQSAVSQRIKQLEQNIAQPVLIRSQPLTVTQVGKKLINHYYQVVQLEADLLPDILTDTPQQPLTIHLATNADSLATWLIPALALTIKTNLIELNLLVADERHTLQKLKDGEAFGAISMQQLPTKGCQVTQLGNFNYILVASAEFRDTYFKNGINAATLARAPGVAFDQRDNMHVRFISQQYGLNEGDYPLHAVRSSEAFVMIAKHGAAYCLVSELQIKNELQSGELINLLPDYKLVETLYWHRWTLLKGVHKKISDVIIEQGQRILD